MDASFLEHLQSETEGQALVRTQMSAAYTQDHHDQAFTSFAKVGRDLEIIS